jgi:cell division protein FtsQ
MIAEGVRSRRQARRRAIPRPGPRVIVALTVLVALAIGAWFSLRDSSLVSVRRVAISGVSGPDAGRIRAALTSAAHNMTTLDVKMDQLDTAVGPYPVVKKLEVSTQFPHGMRIHVVEAIPVAEVQLGGRTVAVASDGTLLHDAGALPQLPLIALRAPPGGTRLTSQDGLTVVRLLAAAPYQLVTRLSQASSTGAHGLVAQLRDGPNIFFGDGNRLRAKWTAASEVLANSGSAGAEYIDVTDPDRPVAGASTASSPSVASSSAATASASPTTTAASQTSAVGG